MIIQVIIDPLSVPVAVILAVDLALSQTIQEEEAKKPTFNNMIRQFFLFKGAFRDERFLR